MSELEDSRDEQLPVLSDQFKGEDADQEQTLERFECYFENMDRVFCINWLRRATGERIEFDNWHKKDFVQVEGGPNMRTCPSTWERWKVEDSKIRNTLKGRENQMAAVHKLFSSMVQGVCATCGLRVQGTGHRQGGSH